MNNNLENRLDKLEKIEKIDIHTWTDFMKHDGPYPVSISEEFKKILDGAL